MRSRKDLKQDLVKQFELLTLQEIKNHKDAILAANILNNKLSEKVDDLEKRLDCQRFGHRDAVNDLTNELNKIKNESREQHYHSKCIEEGSWKQKDLFLEEVKSLKQELEALNQRVSDGEVLIRLQKKEIDYLKESKIELEKQLKYELDKKDRNEQAHRTSMEARILAIPCKDKDKTESLQSEMEQVKLSIRFHKEEMENHKEKRFYNEKQIEYLMTQLDRLKKKVNL